MMGPGSVSAKEHCVLEHWDIQGLAPDEVALVANCHLPLLSHVAWPTSRSAAADGDFPLALAKLLIGGARSVVICATAADVGDSVLFALLDEYQTFISSDRPIATAPRLGLIIGRDVAILERNLRKFLAPTRKSADRTELTLFTPNRPEHRVASLLLPSELRQEALVSNAALSLEELTDAYTKPVAAAAIATHGFDSCADGGDGAVLCGLRANLPLPPGGEPGYLACGHGVACPRGPRPLKLSEFGANILMVAACNGLRARDSVLTNDFNLALEFAEGSGEGYASTVFSAQGNIFAATAFLAALASGHDLASATLLANALISRGGLERTAYLPVGRLGARLTRQAPTVVDLLGREVNSIIIDTAVNCVEVRLDSSRWLELFKSDRLGLLAVENPDGPIFWFARMVHATFNQGRYLELFLFSFPHSLQGLCVEPWNLESALVETRTAPQGIARWLELGRLNDPQMNDIWQAAANEFENARQSLFGIIRAGAYTVISRSAATGLLGNLQESEQFIRRAVSDEIVCKLSNTFWLSNVLAEEYRVTSFEDSRCTACAGRAVEKSLSNIARGESRTVIVCARCGIVSDIRAGGSITGVQFDSPLVGHRGESFTAELSVLLDEGFGPDDLEVQVRLSTLGQLSGEPVSQTTLPCDTGLARYQFEFELPVELRPHRFFIKAYVSTAHDFAFGSRVFFVN